MAHRPGAILVPQSHPHGEGLSQSSSGRGPIYRPSMERWIGNAVAAQPSTIGPRERATDPRSRKLLTSAGRVSSNTSPTRESDIPFAPFTTLHPSSLRDGGDIPQRKLDPAILNGEMDRSRGSRRSRSVTTLSHLQWRQTSNHGPQLPDAGLCDGGSVSKDKRIGKLIR